MFGDPSGEKRSVIRLKAGLLNALANDETRQGDLSVFERRPIGLSGFVQRKALDVSHCNAQVDRSAWQAVRLGNSMILLLICLCGTALSYYLGVRTPPAYVYGTLKGWMFALLIGAVLTLIFYAFSTFGLMVSLDTLLGDF